MRRLLTSALIAGIGCVCLTSCATNLGSRSLPAVRFNYTEAIARSAEQQMLVNIVRLRHLRMTVFLQVSSVVTQHSLVTNVGVSGAYNVVAPGGFAPQGTAGASAGLLVEERPTITYTPLQGEEFVRRLGTPLSATAIAQLIQAGWPWDAVLSCCVHQVGGLFAPTSPRRGGQSDFQRLGTMLRNLQESHALSVRMSSQEDAELVFAVPGTEEGRRNAAEVRSLLGLDPEGFRYRLAPQGVQGGPDSLSIVGHSMLATLYYLSQGVEGPSRGRPVLGSDALLHIRAAKKAPDDAYASVEYEGQAFYIAADDIESQSIFVLLTFLFTLMSTPGGGGPVVTVGAGG